MSINVTVSGNPVRITRGKMVTACDSSKSEFDKRRLMRLEQVRQQSKDIAESIRNKLKKEKTKHLSQVEIEGEAKLKKWQARKLLELQNQYQEALEDIGLGHKQAIQEEKDEEIFSEQQKCNDRIAVERGRAAGERLQIEKNDGNLKKAVPIQRKKIVRDMENVRSGAVSTLYKGSKGKSPAKKKKLRQESLDSDSENRVPHLHGLEGLDIRSCTCSEMDEIHDTSNGVLKTSKEQQTSNSYFWVPTTDKAAQTATPEDPTLSKINGYFVIDTRISERIKRRTRLNPEPDYCDLLDEKCQTKSILCDCCKSPVETQKNKELINDNNLDILTNDLDAHQKSLLGEKRGKDSDHIPTNKSSASMKLVDLGPIEKSGTSTTGGKGDSKANPSKARSEEIPAKPKITLRTAKSRPAVIKTDKPARVVKYYDHPNRFTKHYFPEKSHIDKVDDDSIIISPNILSEDEIRERMRQRDVEAHLRGQAAVEKERIQREYRDLLTKLPVLQKQERICEIGMDREKYHMSRDRLEELEKKRQNRLDNAYEELFVRSKPGRVTLPRRQSDDLGLSSLNVGTWDVDFDPNSDEKSRSEQLSLLLNNLKAQKDYLLNEIENTVSKQTSDRLVKGSYDDVKSKSTDYSRVKSKRKRSSEEKLPSQSSSDLLLGEDLDIKTKPSRKGTLVSTSPSPRKKAKLKSSRKVLVLQNTSTQTTPKAEQSAATSPLVNTPVSDHEICTCHKDPSLDDMCEIVIKIKEDEKPEVIVNPSVMGKTVKVITENNIFQGEDGESIHQKEEVKAEDPKKDKSHDTKTKKKTSPRKPKDDNRKLTKGDKTSWRESLSRTASSHSTTSTSYFDPPNVLKVPNKISGFEKPSQSINSSTSSRDHRKLDPRLLLYIKKLLNMSRASIDDLTVSASDVSTPTASVIGTPANNPLQQLLNVMKYFNLDAAELSKQLSYISDENNGHYNTSQSVTVSSNTTSDGQKSIQFKSCSEIDDGVSRKIDESNKKLIQYADIAASCTQKISNLTAMIEKVRAEKKQILQSPPSSGEDLTKTSYMQLPDKNDEEVSIPSRQDELDKKLLNIDYNYAEKLKQLSAEEMQSERQRKHDRSASDQELLVRLKMLLQDTGKDNKLQDIGEDNSKLLATVKQKTIVHLKSNALPKDNKNEQSYPIFLDIPKLPRLETPSFELDKKKKRPPPSKGLRAIATNVPIIPHELSTIIEADSQLSTKAESPSKAKSSSASSKSSNVPDILTEANNKDIKSQSTTTSTDVSEMETMETMLVSIGMEWAIPTLKKTRDALAMASSSSGSKDSGDLSLREFLSKISSSSDSHASLLSDSQGLSLIQADNRRTSTPITNNKEIKKGEQPAFLTDSDISSVKDQSDGTKEKFFDLNEESVSK